MNHETTIKRIKELVPDVMKLEFGCELKLIHTSHKVRNAKVLAHMGGGSFRVQERIDTSKNEEEYEKNYGHCDIAYYEPNSFEIIGKPITLSVVLLALGKAKIDVGASVSFRNDGELAHIFPKGASLKPEPIKNTHISVDTRRALWNLKKDNFNDQSEETKTFIGELLK